MVSFRKFTKDNYQKIVNFENVNPFDILGPHFIEDKKEFFVNCFFPNAVEVKLLPSAKTRKEQLMKVISSAGFFQAYFNNINEAFEYKFLVKYAEGYPIEMDDAYGFTTDITDFDLYLLGTGNLYKSYDNFGARIREKHGVKGVEFVVWAPGVQSLCVTGNFNQWGVGNFPMHNVNGSGVWALFVPGLGEGEVYKYALKPWKGDVFYKSDPYAFEMELRP